MSTENKVATKKAVSKKEVAVETEEQRLEREALQKFSGDLLDNEVVKLSELLPAKRTAEMKKMSNVDLVLTQLHEKTKDLKIKGIEDKEGYKLVSDWRKLAKRIRLAGKEMTKAGREHAVKIQAAWVKVEKDFIAKVSKDEDRLEEMEKEHDRLVEADKINKLEEQSRKYTERVTLLSSLGVLYDTTTHMFSVGLFQVMDSMVREADEDIFKDLLEDFRAEIAVVDAEAKELEKKNEERRINDLRYVRQNLLALADYVPENGVEDGDVAHWEQSKFEAVLWAANAKKQAAKDEADRIALAEREEKLANRIQAFREIGFSRDGKDISFRKEGRDSLIVGEDEIFDMDDHDFKVFYYSISNRVEEIEKAYQAAQDDIQRQREEDVRRNALRTDRTNALAAIRTVANGIDLADLSEEDWQTRYASALERFNTAKKVADELEMATKGDKEQWSHFIDVLSRISLPSAKSKNYKAKVDAAKGFIDQIKQL